MKTLTAFFCLLFVANGVLADPYSAAIRQAKNVAANASNSRQDNDNPTPPAQPLPASPTQNNQPPARCSKPPGKTSPASALILTPLVTGRHQFGRRAKAVIDEQSDGGGPGTKPTPASVARLADDLMTAMAGNEKLRPQHQKLAQDVHAIFNSSHLSPAQQHKIIADVQTLLQNGGVPPDDVTNVVNDIKAIATETK